MPTKISDFFSSRGHQGFGFSFHTKALLDEPFFVTFREPKFTGVLNRPVVMILPCASTAILWLPLLWEESACLAHSHFSRRDAVAQRLMDLCEETFKSRIPQLFGPPSHLFSLTHNASPHDDGGSKQFMIVP